MEKVQGEHTHSDMGKHNGLYRVELEDEWQGKATVASYRKL